jgi:hypothetical protein
MLSFFDTIMWVKNGILVPWTLFPDSISVLRFDLRFTVDITGVVIILLHIHVETLNGHPARLQVDFYTPVLN